MSDSRSQNGNSLTESALPLSSQSPIVPSIVRASQGQLGKLEKGNLALMPNIGQSVGRSLCLPVDSSEAGQCSAWARGCGVNDYSQVFDGGCLRVQVCNLHHRLKKWNDHRADPVGSFIAPWNPFAYDKIFEWENAPHSIFLAFGCRCSICGTVSENHNWRRAIRCGDSEHFLLETLEWDPVFSKTSCKKCRKCRMNAAIWFKPMIHELNNGDPTSERASKYSKQIDRHSESDFENKCP